MFSMRLLLWCTNGYISLIDVRKKATYPHGGFKGAREDVVHRQLRVVAPHLCRTHSLGGRHKEAVLRRSACTGWQVLRM